MAMFSIVSWHFESRDLCFWDGQAWGGSRNAKFFADRKEAEGALKQVKPPVGTEFLKPNVLDVDAYNETFGSSIGPRPKVIPVETCFDARTGILERIETRERKQR